MLCLSESVLSSLSGAACFFLSLIVTLRRQLHQLGFTVHCQAWAAERDFPSSSRYVRLCPFPPSVLATLAQEPRNCKTRSRVTYVTLDPTVI